VQPNFSLLKDVQTGSGVQTTSYSVGIGGFFPGAKRPGSVADQSPQFPADIKNEWTCAIMACTGTVFFLKKNNKCTCLYKFPIIQEKMKLSLTWNIFFSSRCIEQTAGPDLAVLFRAQHPNQTVAVFL